MTIESALVILIPEAEDLLETYRKRYDPAAAGSFPAHVTILYPFKSPDALTPGITKTLHRLFLTQPSFTTSFPEIQCFPDMLYLAPVPAEPFRQLTKMIVRHFPETPPYGGAFAEIVPHLTIAQASNGRPLDKIAADFMKTARKAIPIQTRVNAVTLMVDSGDCWEVREHFPLRRKRQVG